MSSEKAFFVYHHTLNEVTACHQVIVYEILTWSLLEQKFLRAAIPYSSKNNIVLKHPQVLYVYGIACNSNWSLPYELHVLSHPKKCAASMQKICIH